jgi:hypothetical protein
MSNTNLDNARLYIMKIDYIIHAELILPIQSVDGT